MTQYTVYDESFFGAYDANRINTAVNAIMAALENGTDLYEVCLLYTSGKCLYTDQGQHYHMGLKGKGMV